MAVAIGFLSLPTELICFILSLLPPRDLCRCAITCKAVRDAAQNSIHVQYKLELHAQGFTETAALDSIDVNRKMSSLKRLASLWRSGFHTNTIFQDTNTTSPVSVNLPGRQYVKCGIWWMWENENIFIRDCNTDRKLSHPFPRHERLSQDRFSGSVRTVVLDPIQDLVVVIPMPGLCTVTGTEQDHHIFTVEVRMTSSLLPHPDSVDASLKCKHSFDASGQYRAAFLHDPAICGDRVVVLYRMLKLNSPANMAQSDMFIQVINWRKGYAEA
ncbi:hypothetical protein DEU56DRAFT_825426, partial [Suillus clintonianus]|uniref:uncharacterized protein n=1 Tax=Suillus clintonianus TaxID=1904413 RepID=UPI001B860B99